GCVVGCVVLLFRFSSCFCFFTGKRRNRRCSGDGGSAVSPSVRGRPRRPGRGTGGGRARRDQVTTLMVKTTLSTLSDELWTVALATSVYVPVSRAPCAMLRLNSATPFCRLKVRVGPPHRVPPPVFCPSWIVT